MSRLWLCLSLCLLLVSFGRSQDTSAPKRQPAAASEVPLPEADPYTFLEKCLERYDRRGIKGYTAIMQKQERVNGELKPTEITEVFVRDQPHSVLMRWLKGEGKASSALFVEGENDGMMLAHPAGLAGKFVSYVRRDPEGEDARQSSRYSIKELGIRKATQRTLKDWKAARDQGTLRVSYLGVRKVREAGDRLCYTLRRTCAKPEEDGVLEGTFHIDTESGMQVGTVLKGEGGKLIGEYFFRDIKINPEFDAHQFDKSALNP